MRASITLPGGRAAGCLGRLVPSIVAVAFLVMGSWFAFLMGRGLLAAASVYGWDETDCEIVASAVDGRPDGSGGLRFVFTVGFRYQAGGQERLGNRLRPSYDGSDDPRPAQLLLQRYPTGARVRCYVNPREPAAATLERPSLWPGLFILFPLLFVAVGAVILSAIWWSGSPTDASAKDPGAAGAPPLSRRTPAAGWGIGCICAFLGIFVLVGLGILWFLTLRPVARVWASAGWRETPCVVERSAVGTHASDDGATYSVDVLYAYTVDGREYKATRYDFLPGSTSGYERKAAIVERLPAGTRTVCWVNPDDPTDAVLEPDLHRGYLFGLFGLPFLLAGAGGIALTLRSWRGAGRQRQAGAPEWLPASPVAAAGPDVLGAAVAAGPVTLRPRATPLGKFLGLTLAALFWNGITGVFVWQMVKGWREGAGDGCLTLFLVPFVLVGLALIAGVPYQFLALFNPRPVLTLERGTIAPGERLQLSWRFGGLAGRIRRLRISVEGREEATYRRGTSSTTDKSTFADLTLVDTTQPSEIAAGSTRLAIPADAMHTFVTAHNKILWSLKVAGGVARWPDVAEEFELLVVPENRDSVRPLNQMGSAR